MAKNSPSTSQQLQQIVIERLKRIPSHLQVSIGNSNYSKEELVESVIKGNKLGKTIANIHLRYLRDLASGKIFADE